MKKTNIELALSAIALVKQGGTYEERDCQGFVEKALSNIGMVFNFRGSNEMLRNMVTDVTHFDTFHAEIGDIIFWVRHDGNEPSRYHKSGDGYKKEFENWNAHHVGIYLGNGFVAESAKGIGRWAVTDALKRKCTHSAKMKNLEYVIDKEGAVKIAIESVLNLKIKDIRKSTPAEPRPPLSKYAIVSSKVGLNLREAASTQALVITRMENGANIDVVETIGNWSKVKYKDITGYCVTKLIRFIDKPQMSFADVEKLLSDCNSKISALEERVKQLEDYCYLEKKADEGD